MNYDNEESFISAMIIIDLFSLLEDLFILPLFIALSFVYINLRNKERHPDATEKFDWYFFSPKVWPGSLKKGHCLVLTIIGALKCSTTKLLTSIRLVKKELNL